jgi:hypothetical protein
MRGDPRDRVLRTDFGEGREKLGDPERGEGSASAQRENFRHARL